MKGDLINNAVWERNVSVEDICGVMLIDTTAAYVPKTEAEMAKTIEMFG